MAAAPDMPANPTSPPPGMMQQATDPLAQLRDIHAPGMIDTWPPAPGWWLLAILGVAALIAGLVWLFRRWRANRYRREALAELSGLKASWSADRNDLAYLESLQRLLKRVALTSFPRDNVASLTGEAWVQFLDRSTGTHDFSIGAAEVLIDGNYRRDLSVDIEQLHRSAKNWIRNHHVRYLQAEQRAQAQEAQSA